MISAWISGWSRAVKRAAFRRSMREVFRLLGLGAGILGGAHLLIEIKPRLPAQKETITSLDHHTHVVVQGLVRVHIARIECMQTFKLHGYGPQRENILCNLLLWDITVVRIITRRRVPCAIASSRQWLRLNVSLVHACEAEYGATNTASLG